MSRKASLPFIPATACVLAQAGCKVLLVGVLSLTGLVGCGKAAPPQAAAPEVAVVTPVQRDVPVYLDLVGQAQGQEDIEIRARVDGYLDAVLFKDGAYVTKGTPLYQIDPKPLQADLATVQARLMKATTDVNRLRPLAEKQAVSRQELDNALAAYDAARAQVDLATLNLGYASITSPIDGVVGITQVKPGTLIVRNNSTLMTTVSKVDPIVFRVGISEAEYLKLAKRGPRPANGDSDVELILADGSTYPQKGVFDAVDRAVDTQTGTLTLQFHFSNPDRLIRPGQYGRVRCMVDKLSNALLVPQRAVNEIQGMYQVAVVGTDNKVSLRTVKVGPRVDNLWVITEGLQTGEQIVAEGLQRVRDGMAVSPSQVSPASMSPPAASTSAAKP